MKKLSLLFVLAFGCLTISSAQVCKISGAGDNVEVMSCNFADNKSTVIVNVSNDSKTDAANVAVEIKVTYGSRETKTYIGKTRASANDYSEIRIPISPEIRGLEATKVEVENITGTKCL